MSPMKQAVRAVRVNQRSPANAASRQALGDALAAVKDHLSQTELAVRAVQRAWPDMTASDALTAVNLVRHE